MICNTGTYSWTFHSSNCTDEGVSTRNLNLHRKVDRPGTFCCNNGKCIDSSLVCDGEEHCDDMSDENQCKLFQLEQGYRQAHPPKKSEYDNFILQDVEAFVDIIKIIDIDETEATFTLVFNITLEWNDHRMSFNFLHDDTRKNKITKQLLNNIWFPMINYQLVMPGQQEY